MTTPTPPGYWTPNAVPRLATPGGRPPINSWAWAGLIASVSGFIFPVGVNGVLGVIFSIFGLREARRISAAGFSEDGRSLALAGVIVGIVHIVVTIALIVGLVFAVQWFYTWIETLTSEVQNATQY
jgi:Domain of unknown function (DUF4190)